MLTAASGKEISKEEGDNPLIPSSTIVSQLKSYVDIVVRLFRNDDTIQNDVTDSFT
jgi:uncharacterized protein (UPF0335 family)